MQNWAPQQFIWACLWEGGGAGQSEAEPAGEGERKGWLVAGRVLAASLPIRGTGLPCASAVSWSLFRAACDAWDLGPAVLLSQSVLFSWLPLLPWNTVLVSSAVQAGVGAGLWQPGLSIQAVHSLSYAREPSFVWTKAVVAAGSSIPKVVFGSLEENRLHFEPPPVNRNMMGEPAPCCGTWPVWPDWFQEKAVLLWGEQ